MDETHFVYLTGGVISLYFLYHVLTGRFDPFATVWLFLVGYVQVYVIQALSYHEWAIGIRGKEVVAAANFRATLGPGLVFGRLPTSPGPNGCRCAAGPAAQLVAKTGRDHQSAPHSLGPVAQAW